MTFLEGLSGSPQLGACWTRVCLPPGNTEQIECFAGEVGEGRLERVTVLGLAKLLESQGGSWGAQG